MLINGLSDKPRSIWVNGREYPECVDRTALYFEALYFEEGWFMQKDGTVIVRLYDHSETELQVEMQSSFRFIVHSPSFGQDIYFTVSCPFFITGEKQNTQKRKEQRE